MKVAPVTVGVPEPRHPDPKAGRDFEAMVLGRMVDDMLSTIDLGAFAGGHAEETWRSFLSDAIGRSLADQGRTGIAAQIDAAIDSYRKGST